MKTTEKVKQNIAADKELTKAISKISYYSPEQFTMDATRYIKAIKERRMLCIIPSISRSGMSRVIRFLAPEPGRRKQDGYSYLNYFCFFKAMGYTESRGKDGFTIGGCGMDMVFHTNYTIINRLTRMGFLAKKEGGILAQQTPHVL